MPPDKARIVVRVFFVDVGAVFDDLADGTRALADPKYYVSVHRTTYPIDTSLTDIEIADMLWKKCQNTEDDRWTNSAGQSSQRSILPGDVVSIYDPDDAEEPVTWYVNMFTDQWKELSEADNDRFTAIHGTG
jgi:hypothetical protein